MSDPIQTLRDRQRDRPADGEFAVALTQVENLVQAAEQIDFHGLGLITQEYRQNSPLVTEMISNLKDALAPFKDTP